AVGSGPGAESRRPLGAAVVGGLLISQIITLYLTPVFYTYMESLQQWVRRMRGKATPVAVEQAATVGAHDWKQKETGLAPSRKNRSSTRSRVCCEAPAPDF